MTFRFSYSERPASPVTYAILDKAVNVTCDDNFVTFDGAQVKEISVAGRTDEGVPLAAGRHFRSGAIRIKVNSDISLIELKYKGNIFNVTVYRTGEAEGSLSVSSLKQSTLELIPYEKLPYLYESLVKP
ncbi:MAG: hypothetical protein HGB35_03885 [Geobacteraceae bacterium]|nr:hypothetical protein [Geobacteraceae bacterium]